MPGAVSGEQGEKGMKTYSRKIKDGFWYISVAAERRTAVIESLNECPGVVTARAYCPIGETDSEKIKVLVSERIDEDSQNEILAICDGTEPEKPARHPILDAKWHKGGEMFANVVFDDNGKVVSHRHPDIIVHVPKLLKALEAYTNIGGDDNWQKVCIIIASMGLAFTPST